MLGEGVRRGRGYDGAKDADGATPLHIAAQSGQHELVRALVNDLASEHYRFWGSGFQAMRVTISSFSFAHFFFSTC